MATEKAFIEYVCDQAREAGGLASRRMFGEYALYCDAKVVALVCDNQVFVKPTGAGRAWLGTVTEGFPFPGARPWLLVGTLLDDHEAFARLIRLTADALPPPQPGRPRKRGALVRNGSAGP